MKNSFKIWMLVAVAAMGFTACSESDAESASPSKLTKTISVVSEITRTEFNEDYSRLLWSEGDSFGAFTDIATDVNLESAAYTAGAKSFELEVDASATEVYAYYPYYSGNSEKAASSLSIGIPASQTQSVAGQLTGKNLPMVAQGAIEENSVALRFQPAACVLAINIYGDATATAKVNSVKFTSSEKSSGYDGTYNLTNAEDVYTPYNTTTTLTLEGDAQFVPNGTKPTTLDNAAFMVVAKATYPAGTTLEVGLTDGTTYTFTTTGTIDCTKTYTTLNLNLTKGEKKDPQVVNIPDGPYVVLKAKKDGTGYWAMDISKNGSRQVAVDFNWDGTATSVAAATNLIWEVEKLNNNYTIKQGDQYVSFTKNGVALTSKATELQFEANENGSYVIADAITTSSDASTRRLTVNEGYGFGFYASSTGVWEIFLVSATMDTTPAIVVDETNISLGSNAVESATLTYTTKNLAGVTVNATSDQEWLKIGSCEDGVLTYSTEANSGAERSATITLTAEGATDVVITITQDAYRATTISEDIVQTFGSDTFGSSISSYTDTWTNTCGDYSWSISNFNNNNKAWSLIKCGRKSDASVASISTKFAIPWAVSNVKVVISTLTSTYAKKVNSAYLQVATDSEFTNVIETVNVTLTGAGTIDYEIQNPTANCYYKLVYDIQVAGSNGIIAINKVTYVAQ